MAHGTKTLGLQIFLVLSFAIAGCGGGTSVGSPRVTAVTPPLGVPSPSSQASVAPTATPIGSGASPAAYVDPSPGPSILYAPVASAPQLVNTGIWVAKPILVSGASSYRSGEYVYQDFLFDDHGAKGTLDPSDNEIVAEAFALPSGTYTYPSAQVYGSNAADLVEFRLKPTAGATAFRVTFNTMIDPALVAFTIGLGGGTTSYAMPHGANASEPAQLFLTVHGTTADVVDAATGLTLATTSPATVTDDVAHRQVTVMLPYSTLDTRGSTALRVTIAAGLWNASTNAYLTPGATASATAPGGAVALAPAAFFNVGFRHSEPAYGVGYGLGMGSSWRESAQAAALANNDLSSFYDLVDMTKVAAGVNDDMIGQTQGVPQNGFMDRVLESRFEPYQGRDFSGCDGSSTVCSPEFGSALEPYAIYVPKEPPPAAGYQTTLLLHADNTNYNQFANTNNESQLGERSVPSIVFTTEGRGPDNWYQNVAEAEIFEVWADVRAHYPLDPTRSATSGYSMGGYASFKLIARYPDLFAKMEEEVGGSASSDASKLYTETQPMFPNYRNIPVMSWVAQEDELLLPVYTTVEEQMMARDKLNFQFDELTPADHLAMAINDQFSPVATFLGSATIDPNPPHVTYVIDPSMDNATDGVVADHAYWISNVTQRNKTSSFYATMDVLSDGFGLGDPSTSGTQAVAGTLPPGNLPGCCTFVGFKDTYNASPAISAADTLNVSATDIATVTIDPIRAHVDCNAQLNVTTDGPLTITLAGCPAAQVFTTSGVRRARQAPLRRRF